MAGDYYVRLAALVEKMHEKNDDQPILLISHSMGSPYTLHFLHKMSSTWKDKYIKAWMSVAGAFAGSVKALKAALSGELFEIPSMLIKRKVVREFQRTWPGVNFLFPDYRIWHKVSLMKLVGLSSFKICM